MSQSHDSVRPGDTFGSFCQRHGLSREALFDANPHLLEFREVLSDGTWTAPLEVGEVLALPEFSTGGKNPTTMKIDQKTYLAAQECARAGNIPDDEGPTHSSCHATKEENGVLYAQDLDGTWKEISRDKYDRWVKEVRPCLLSDGYLSDGVCKKTGMDNGDFVVFLQEDQPIVQEQKKDEGMSSTSKVVLVGGAVLLGVGILKFLL